MRFEMTHDDIQKARGLLRKNDPYKSRYTCCPVAQCLRRVSGEQAIGAGPTELSVGKLGWFPTPDAVHKFMQDFDFDRPVAPITFELPIEAS